MKVFGNLLVVLRAHIVDNDGRLTRHHEQGFYAFDLNDFSQKHFLHGTYDYFRADCEHFNTLVVKRGHLIDVFILESDGHVDQTGSFNLFSRKHNPLVMLSQSRIDVGIYEYRRRTDSTTIKLFNTRNGELLHTIALPRVVLDVATNGRELYFLSGGPNRKRVTSSSQTEYDASEVSN